MSLEWFLPLWIPAGLFMAAEIGLFLGSMAFVGDCLSAEACRRSLHPHSNMTYDEAMAHFPVVLNTSAADTAWLRRAQKPADLNATVMGIVQRGVMAVYVRSEGPDEPLSVYAPVRDGFRRSFDDSSQEGHDEWHPVDEHDDTDDEAKQEERRSWDGDDTDLEKDGDDTHRDERVVVDAATGLRNRAVSARKEKGAEEWDAKMVHALEDALNQHKHLLPERFGDVTTGPVYLYNVPDA